MKKILISILILFVFVVGAEAATFTSRDIKQPSETKLFISGNHQTPDFEDLSANKNQLTKYGDVKTVNEKSATNPKYFPVGQDKGIYFDGTGDYLTSAASTDWDFGTGNFTIDTWVNFSTVQSSWLISPNDGSSGKNWIQFHASGTTLHFSCYTGGTSRASYYCPFIPIKGVWYHVAVVRNGSSILLFINGVGQTVTTNTALNGNLNVGSYPFYLGYNSYNNSSYLDGFLQNVRWSKGIARWTSNFTPPALNSTYPTDSYTKLYIKGHDKVVNTTAMTDDSGTSKTITTVGDTKAGYSRGVASYFDGTGDYLTCPKIGSDDYTKTTSVELWYYPTANNNTKILVARGHQTNGDFYLAAETQALTFRKYYTSGSGVYGASLASVFSAVNKWYHIVAEYDTGATDSGVVNFWVNGIKTAVNKGSSTATYTANTGTTIGGYLTTSPMIGYIAGLKVTEDNITPYAVGNFTPPETEPVADQYTKLLLKQEMLAIRDIATAKAITTAGSPNIVTTTVRNGKYSINFNAAADSISTPYSIDFNFGTGNHTLDFWVYCNSDANDFVVFSNKNADTSYFYYVTCESNKLKYQCNVAGYRCIYSCDFNPAANTWYHVAVIRNGNTCLMFINGVSQVVTETTAFTGDIGCTSPNPLYIGYDIYGASRYINGYLSDVRITKGKALWTSNFTPPRRSGAF